MESKITPNTRGIVIINPNNPTGSVYPRHVLAQIVALAKKYDLILFADEIYDKIVYDGIEHVSVAALAATSCAFHLTAYQNLIVLRAIVQVDGYYRR